MKEIVKVWEFDSSSGSKKYETLLYADGSTSCSCPGWTRRCGPGNRRTCRHTRTADMGTADHEARSFYDYRENTMDLPKPKPSPLPRDPAPNRLPTYGQRKLAL